MRRVTPCCPPVLAGSLDSRQASELASSLKALADPIRLRLLSFIAAQPNREACVCHLVEPAGLSQPTVTHHLQRLHRAGLLEREKRGAWVYYRAVPQRLEAICAALAVPTNTRTTATGERRRSRRRA